MSDKKRRSRRRVTVASANKRRLATGSLSATPHPPPSRTGRPPKEPGEKAKGITVTLWPDELDAIEQLRAQVSQGLPVAVSRSDLTRVAFQLAVAAGPKRILSMLSKLPRD